MGRKKTTDEELDLLEQEDLTEEELALLAEMADEEDLEEELSALEAEADEADEDEDDDAFELKEDKPAKKAAPKKSPRKKPAAKKQAAPKRKPVPKKAAKEEEPIEAKDAEKPKAPQKKSPRKKTEPKAEAPSKTEEPKSTAFDHIPVAAFTPVKTGQEAQPMDAMVQHWSAVREISSSISGHFERIHGLLKSLPQREAGGNTFAHKVAVAASALALIFSIVNLVLTVNMRQTVMGQEVTLEQPRVENKRPPIVADRVSVPTTFEASAAPSPARQNNQEEPATTEKTARSKYKGSTARKQSVHLIKRRKRGY